MFGISFAKLVVLIAVVTAIWIGFRYLTRRERAREEALRAAAAAPPGPAPRPPGQPAATAEDLVKCPACGIFTARGVPCGRAGCPNG